MTLLIDKKTILGKGATANIYNGIENGVNVAVKIYHANVKINKSKIDAMLSNVPVHIKINSEGIEIPILAWPSRLIEEDGVAIGYVMPLVNLNDSFPLDYYYDKILFKKLNAPDEAALSFKIDVAKNLSSVVSDLHNNGHYFIDLKPQNIRVFRKTHDVTLLDCDGFSIQSKNGIRYPADLISTDYIAPEVTRENLQPKELGEYQDRYALAVILFQLLNNGTHPFQGILISDIKNVHTNDEKAAAGLYPHGKIENPQIKPRSHSIHHLWQDSTRDLFDRAFAGSPERRPSAKEWADHFKNILSKRELVRCDKYPNQVAHMRYRDKNCPECYLEKIPKINTAQNRKKQIPINGNTTSNQEWQPLWWIVGIFILLGLLIKCSASSNTDYVPAPAAENNYTPPAPDIESSKEYKTDIPNTQAAPQPPQPYAAVYVDDSSNVFGWGAGYSSEKDAKIAAKKSCHERGATGKCVKTVSGPYRCLALAISASGYRFSYLADTQAEAEELVLKNCEADASGGSCYIPSEGSGCSTW